jgi:MoaA/NifB/PqqE/SkfB family radical SAM enzyme
MLPQSIWNRFFPRKFDWLQLAVTSHCNASCSYCPHTVYRRHWQNRHLTLETFRCLLPDLKKVNLVYLQGWGEPFLNPDFFAFVSLAKQAGCRVGTTTNATLLARDTIARIVDSGIDVVAFSLAGIGETHDTWRRGTSYQQVLEAIQSLQECKRSLGVVLPGVHIAYMLLRAGLPELAKLPGELQELGLAQVVISTLDLVAGPELEKESLTLVTGSEQAEISQRLEEVAAAGARRGLAIHYAHRSGQGEPLACPENVRQGAVLSPFGEVSPCVYTNVPTLAGDYYVRGEPHQLQPWSFGNVQDFSFQEIWRQPEYRQFRRSWRRGNLAGPCRHCLKLKGSF